MSTMAAIGAFAGKPLSDLDALKDIRVDVSELRPHDVLVRVAAVSGNPVDVKRRAGLATSATPVIFGYDAAGTIEAIGFSVGRRRLVRRRHHQAR